MPRLDHKFVKERERESILGRGRLSRLSRKFVVKNVQLLTLVLNLDCDWRPQVIGSLFASTTRERARERASERMREEESALWVRKRV